MTDIFDTYLKSHATRETYRYVWNNLVLKTLKISEKDILSLDKKDQEQKVIDYVDILKTRGNAPTTISLRLNVMEFVFSMHDIILNWKKLKKMIPEKVKPAGAETWQDQELREMIKVAGTVRNRTLVYFFKDVGCRISAVPALRVKDTEEFENCFCVMIYAGFPEEYPSFLTPESTKMLKHYLEYRKKRGEIITPESPLFASELAINSTIKPITNHGIQNAFGRIYLKFPNSRVKQGQRYNIQLTHGFRKWQATKLKLKIDVHHSISERLLGHKAGLDSNYFVTNQKDAKLKLFEVFKQCISDLTLDKSEIIEDIENYSKKLDDMQKKYNDLVKSIEKIGQGIRQGTYFDYKSSDSPVITTKSQESD